jgi:hypothetical protein
MRPMDLHLQLPELPGRSLSLRICCSFALAVLISYAISSAWSVQYLDDRILILNCIRCSKGQISAADSLVASTSTIGQKLLQRSKGISRVTRAETR